jgi:hypothetical protein
MYRESYVTWNDNSVPSYICDMIQILELDQQYMVQAPTATTKVAIYLQNDEVIQCELFCFTLLLSSIKECIFGFFKKKKLFCIGNMSPTICLIKLPRTDVTWHENSGGQKYKLIGFDNGR